MGYSYLFWNFEVYISSLDVKKKALTNYRCEVQGRKMVVLCVNGSGWYSD